MELFRYIIQRLLKVLRLTPMLQQTPTSIENHSAVICCDMTCDHGRVILIRFWCLPNVAVSSMVLLKLWYNALLTFFGVNYSSVKISNFTIWLIVYLCKLYFKEE